MQAVTHCPNCKNTLRMEGKGELIKLDKCFCSINFVQFSYISDNEIFIIEFHIENFLVRVQYSDNKTILYDKNYNDNDIIINSILDWSDFEKFKRKIKTLIIFS